MQFFELFVVLTFAAAWGVVELVARSHDKTHHQPSQEAPQPASHPAEQHKEHEY